MFDGILKQFEEQQNKIQESLADEIIKKSSTGGEISIKMNGNGVLLDCKIAPQILTSDNAEMIEDLLISQLNEAIKESKQKQMEASKSSIGNMLPGGMDLGNLFGS